MRSTLLPLLTALLATGLAATASEADAAVSHTIQPGETLSGIAAANGLSTDSLAAWNGVSSDYLVIAGASISVPANSSGAMTTNSTWGAWNFVASP